MKYGFPMKYIDLKLPLVRARHDSIAANLTKVIESLRNLAGSTEQEFLKLGAELERFVAGAGEQRREIASMVDAINATSGAKLGQVLEDVSRWTAQVGVSQTHVRQLRQLVLIVRAVGDPLKSLDQAVRALRVTGVITRVESARLGSQSGGFDALAAEVASLADAIEAKSNAILEAVLGLCDFLQKTERGAAEFNSRQQAGIGAMMAECTGSFRELEDERLRVEDLTRSTQARYAALTSEIGNMVAGLQSHDSTRQRIEHIVEELDTARRALAAGCSPSAELIELQTAQLDQTRSTFLEAVSGIQSDLGRFREIIAESTRAARELLGARADAGPGFLGNLETHLAAIVSAVSEVSESRRAAASAASDVQQACTRMTGFVAEIETIGGRMLRLALNAEIQAVHLAGTGVVMEAVAEGIRSTSGSASQNARAAGQALRDVEATAAKMNALAANEADMGMACELAAQVRQITSELHLAGQHSTRMLESIAEASQRLSAKIAVLEEGIAASQVFGELSESCIASLREISTLLKPVRGKTKGAGATLARATTKYTMRAEREVHNEFIGAGCPHADPWAPQGSEFGENVELF